MMENNYKKNISRLKKQVDSACRRAGRDPREVTIIAATKYTDIEGVRAVSRLGIHHFGENRSDELLRKKEAAGSQAIWHFIGHLQGRKARDVVPAADYIHSIDSLKILEKVGRQAKKAGKVQDVLIQVNISGEETKYGLEPDNVIDFITKAEKVEDVRLKGLMTMAPYTGDMELIRDLFRKMRQLKDLISGRGLSCFSQLSMGMSNDFEAAIEEGATMIRIGSSIFK